MITLFTQLVLIPICASTVGGIVLANRLKAHLFTYRTLGITDKRLRGIKCGLLIVYPQTATFQYQDLQSSAYSEN